MLNLRKQVILDFKSGKLGNLSFSEIEKSYKIPPLSKRGDRVRRWIQWYNVVGKATNQYAPSQNIVLPKEESVKPLKSKETKEDKTIKNLLLKSTWQAQTKQGIEWLESYTNNVDPLDIKKFRDSLIKDLPSFPKRSFNHEPSKYGVLGVISIPDFHIGRERNIEDNNIFLSTIENLLQKSSHHILDEIIFVIGNDYFNSDFNYSTTKGTPQFDYQHWKETWANGRDLVVQAIEMLKEKRCTVKVINIPGNHDSFRMYQLGDVIQAYYRNDNQILVDNSDRIVKAYKYGNTLLAFEHGEFRREDYESILANEFPELWGTSLYREFLCGHLHAETVKEFRGLKLRHLPSLAKESEWEKKQGYKHKKESQMLVYSKEKLEAIYIV